MTYPWPFAEHEKPGIEFGRQSKHDPIDTFDTDGEGGPLYGTALMPSPAPVTYNNASDCSNLVHVLVDSGISDHYFDDFLISELNQRLLDYTCLTMPRKILTAGGCAARRHRRRNSSGRHHRPLWQRSSRSNPDLSCTYDWAQHLLGEDSNTELYCLHFATARTIGWRSLAPPCHYMESKTTCIRLCLT